MSAPPATAAWSSRGSPRSSASPRSCSGSACCGAAAAAGASSAPWSHESPGVVHYILVGLWEGGRKLSLPKADRQTRVRRYARRRQTLFCGLVVERAYSTRVCKSQFANGFGNAWLRVAAPRRVTSRDVASCRVASPAQVRSRYVICLHHWFSLSRPAPSSVHTRLCHVISFTHHGTLRHTKSRAFRT